MGTRCLDGETCLPEVVSVSISSSYYVCTLAKPTHAHTRAAYTRVRRVCMFVTGCLVISTLKRCFLDTSVVAYAHSREASAVKLGSRLKGRKEVY